MNSVAPPKGERIWLTYWKDKIQLFLLTSKEGSRDQYFLYEVADGGLRKLGKASSPIELESKFGVLKKVGL
jgi:hypothetical protein